MSLIGPTPNPLSLIANLSSTLVTLSLSYTRIRGSLTSDIFCLPNLQQLILSENELSVHLSELSCIASLSMLDLSGCGIQGPISSSFSNLTYLTSLNLMGNQLNSSIPSSLLNLQRLTHLDLSMNELSGQIPNVFDRLTNLQTLFLNNNNFQGKLPSSFYFLTISLVGQSSQEIFHNWNFLNSPIINLKERFTGTFPQCLANCSYLTDLDLQMNNLHDTLPDIFKHLDQLETLNLNGNQFKGLLPKSLSNSINLVDLDLGNNQFEDTFPNWLQNLSTLEILVLRGNKLWSHCQFEI
nr:receptor-like protein 53 [Arachis hypogaea]